MKRLFLIFCFAVRLTAKRVHYGGYDDVILELPPHHIYIELMCRFRFLRFRGGSLGTISAMTLIVFAAGSKRVVFALDQLIQFSAVLPIHRPARNTDVLCRFDFNAACTGNFDPFILDKRNVRFLIVLRLQIVPVQDKIQPPCAGLYHMALIDQHMIFVVGKVREILSPLAS